MSSQDIKQFLFEQTGIAENQWKRLSKHKNAEGLEVRVFQARGTTVHTVENKDGTISIIDNPASDKANYFASESNNSSEINKNSESNKDNKKALSLIKKYYKEEVEPDEDKPGFSLIPQHFSFCFLEDSNEDHSEAIIEAAQAGNAQVAVTGFNLFFMPTFKSPEEVIHLERLLQPFLPEFMGEVQEATFCVCPDTMATYDEERLRAIKDGSIPSISYARLVATLEKAGFTYDKANCMLAPLGGSQGAMPFEEEQSNEFPDFCLLKVNNPNYRHNPNYCSEYLSAIILDTKKTRASQEKLLNKTLKKYMPVSLGRLMNSMLPYTNLIQLTKKGYRVVELFDTDLQNIYDILTEAGWKENHALGSVEAAKAWTVEEWAVSPMAPSTIKTSEVSPTESCITYEIWQKIDKKPKP